MNDVPEAVLHECLDLMEQGKSIEQILAQFPEQADGLRPFLQTTAQLATLAPQPSLDAKRKSQKLFLAHAESLKVTPVRPSAWYRLRQVLLPLVSLAIVLILFSVTAVSVSSSAIPGDALYPVKRLVENVRLNQTRDPIMVATLMEEYRQERIREVQSLLRTGRSAEVSFAGEVDLIQPGSWSVAAIQVALTEATTIVGQPQVGEQALVNGRTAEGQLTASSIKMLTETSVAPDPAETPQPTGTTAPRETPAQTATPTATDTASATAEPDATNTAVPVPTKTAQPTMSPTAAPTAVLPTATASPAPTSPPANDNDDNDNDNENDNGDDGGNDNDENENDNNGDNGNSNDGNENDSNDNGDDGNENDNNNDNGNDNENSNNGNGNDNGNDNDDDDDDD